MEVLAVVLQLFIPAALLLLGGLVGSLREKQHLVDIAEREQRFLDVVVTDVRRLPHGVAVADGARLVSGNVVVAGDYLKRFIASIINLVGGEIESYQVVLDRGRREARLRMLEEAVAAGADIVVNVRYTTTTITLGASEVICYGTALQRVRAAATG